MTGYRVRVGLVTLLLLVGAAACGDDDDSLGGTSGAGPIGGQGDADTGADACSLLEVSEIEAEFGDNGAVADGELLGFSCSWEVGGTGGARSGVVVVTKARGAGSPEQSLAEIRDLDSSPVEVAGVGDEACLCSGGLWFRSGDITFSVSAFFGQDVLDKEAKLTTLAHHMLDDG